MKQQLGRIFRVQGSEKLSSEWIKAVKESWIEGTFCQFDERTIEGESSTKMLSTPKKYL